MSNKQNSVIVSLALLIIINFSGSALATNTIIEDLKITVDERRFTESIAISGDYVIMGSWGSSAYIYKKESTGWIQQDRLTGSGGSTYDRHFGCAVSINGDYAIVGASTDSVNGSLPGSAYIFKRMGTNWVEQINIVPNDGGSDDRFGTSVSIFGDYAIVGSEYHNHLNGAAYIFKRDGENWIQHKKLTACFGYDSRYVYFGRCVSLSANYAVVRGKNDVYIYKNDGKNWIEQTRLTDSSCTSFGNQFAISGDYLLITASANNESFAWIYQNDGENWIKQAKLLPENLTQKDFFGWNLSLSNNYAIISSTDNNIGDTAYIFQRNGESWIEKVKLISSDSYREVDFGQAVAISNEYAIVGAGSSYIDDSNAAYIYNAPFGDVESRTIKPIPPANGQILPSFCVAVPYSDNQSFRIIPDAGYKIFDVKVDEKSVGAVSSYTFNNVRQNHIISASFVLYDAVFVTEDGKNVFDNDFYYRSLDVYEDSIIIGNDSYNMGEGIAYIYKRNGNKWIINALLTPENRHGFGSAVSIYKDYAVVGARYDKNRGGKYEGSVYVFKKNRNSDTWEQQAKLIIPDEQPSYSYYHYFGRTVSIFEDYIISGTGNSNASQAFFFKKQGDEWIQQEQSLYFGEYVEHVLIKDNYAFISPPQEGYVYIYELQNDYWTEIDRLRSVDYHAYDYFGQSFTVFNDYLFVGATRGDSNQADTGSVYVYKKGTHRWVYQEKLVASDGEQYDNFGNAMVAISTQSGDYLFVAAQSDKNDFLNNSGSVYCFKFDGNNWVEQSKLIITDGKENEIFGTSIFTSGQYAFVMKDKDFMGFKGTETAIYTYEPPFNGQPNFEPPKFYEASSDIIMYNPGRTAITVSDANGDILTICAESSNETIVPNAFISIADSGSNVYSINTMADMPQILSMTFFQTAITYGNISIHVMLTDASGLTATQSFSVEVLPSQCLDCGNENIACTHFDIAAAGGNSLILKPDGTVWGWGDNHYGQLGNGFFWTFGNPNPPYSSSWVQAQNLSNVVAISGTSHSLALHSDGKVWAWGMNNYGQVGNGNESYSQSIPVQINHLTDVIAIAAGYYHSLAIQKNGTVWGWGHNNKGQLGDGTTTNQNIPVLAKNLTNVVSISAGVDHSMALRSDGTVWTWGYNNSGQLGYTNTEFQIIPRKVNNLNQVIAITAGFAHCLALKSDGTVWAWGRNTDYQLGNDNTSNQSDPIQVQGLSDIQSIESGAFHNFAIKNDGTVLAWGSHINEITGNSIIVEDNSFQPVPVQNLENIIAVSAGDYNQNLALTKDGYLWIWGFSGEDGMPQKIGELQDGSGSFNLCSGISIETILDQTTYEDVSIDIPVFISQAENDGFTIAVVSDNPSLIINDSKHRYFNQSQVTLTVTPAPNQNGQTKMVVYVIDPKGYISRKEFILTILPINDAPVISHIIDQVLTTSVTSVEIPYTVFDVESYYTDLQYTVTSSNPDFIPDQSISINRTENKQTMVITNISGEGSTVIQLTTTDADGLTTVSMFTFCVNYSPVARGKEISIDEDRYLNILLNATDTDQSQLTYTLVNQPAHGNVSINGDIATYTPDLNFHGLDRFSFIANDGISDSNEGQIILTIYPVNDPPIAQDYSFHTIENRSCAFVLPETDVDGDTIESTIIRQPNNGSISGTSQHFTYIPDDWFWGTDTMVYTLTDGQLVSLTATVTFEVDQADTYTLSLMSNYGFAEIEINGTRVLLPWDASLPSGSEVILNAISSSDQLFEKWSDNIDNPTENPVTFLMDRSETIVAYFSPHRKTITIVGNHSIKINQQIVSLPFKNTYFQGTHLILNAIPEDSFHHWSGDITGSDNPIALDLQSDMLVGVLFDDSDDWQSTIQAETLDLSQVQTDEITIGVSVLGQTEIEQLPSEYACSLLVYSPQWLKYSTDIRKSGASEFRWVIAVNPHGNIGPPDPRTTVLHWDPNQLNHDGSFQMFSGYDQVDEVVVSNMRSITEYTVTGGDSVQYFTIVWSSQLITSVHFDMQVGWNLISLPIIPEDAHVNALFPDIAYAYEYKNGSYASVDQLETGKGYWIKTATTGYDISGEPFTSYTLTLDQGWHLIGAVKNTIVNPFPGECVEVLYSYQNGSYSLDSELVQGKGYWIKLNHTCQLTIGKSGLGPTATTK
jgi:alpha-tubulin suppressor-like RCC1 family protein